MTFGTVKRNFLSRFRANALLITLLFSLLIGLFIKNSSLAAAQVREGLRLCAETVLPAVFPCSVLSAIFISLGGGALVASVFGRPMRAVFGVSGGGCTVLLLGWLCGFPVAAVSGAALVRRGELSGEELSRLMLFSNLPSPAFVISAVGESMLGDRRTGVLLYLALLFSSILTGIALRFIKKPICTSMPPTHIKRNFSEIPHVIGDVASSMICLSAGIVFFSVLSGLLLSLFENILTSPLAEALISGIFELSGGCAAAAALSGKTAFRLCAFLLGWSGLCVHFQIISACDGDIRIPSYLASKFIQACICTLFCLTV